MHTLILLAMLFSLPSDTAAPELSEGVMIQAAGEAIDIHIGHLVPCVTDWNNDGKKDLIVGQYSGGKIRLYLNVGTDEEPSFDEFEYLKANGEEISLPDG